MKLIDVRMTTRETGGVTLTARYDFPVGRIVRGAEGLEAVAEISEAVTYALENKRRAESRIGEEILQREVDNLRAGFGELPDEDMRKRMSDYFGTL